MRISDWSSDVCSSDLALQVRRPLRNHMLWGMPPIRAAESPVVAQESRSLNGAKQRAGRLVRQLRLDEDQRALACTAVDHFADAGLPGDVTLGRQATVQCYLLLAMENAQQVYAQDRKSTRLNSSH